MNWPMRSVSELCLIAVDCVNKTAPTVDHQTPYEMIRTTNVKGGYVYLDEVKFVTEEIFEKWTRRSRPRYGDVILTREAPVGEVGRCTFNDRNIFLGQRLFHYRPNPKLLDWNYLAYVLQSWEVQGRFQGMGFGATVHHVKVGDAENLKIPCPPLAVQKAIGGILAAYDDLIENNRRRIALLEDAARQLYREWFVRLRFPGHEHTRIIDGVPEGWECTTVSSLCTVGRGGSPRPIKDFMDGTVPWFKIGDATSSDNPFVLRTKELLIEDGVKKSVFLPPKELILSNSATCGIPYFTGVSGCIHDGWLYFKNLRRVSKWFLYCCLFEKQQEILMGIGEGATQKNLNTDYIRRQTLTLPKNDLLLGTFSDVVEPLFEQIFTLAQSVTSLTKARDLLLPRLMNGEIAV